MTCPPVVLLGDVDDVAVLHHVVRNVAPAQVIHQLQVQPPPAQRLHQPVVQAQAEALQQLHILALLWCQAQLPFTIWEIFF